MTMKPHRTIRPVVFAASLLATLAASSTFAQDRAPAADGRSEKVDVTPAAVIDPAAPSFPGTFSKPRLVAYPGMPVEQRPGPDWAPEYGLWRLPVRVSLDASGTPVDVSVGDHPLSSQGMVRRYERLALRAARDWSYTPARVDGQAVASELVLPFYFDTALARPTDHGQVGQRTSLPALSWSSIAVRYAVNQ